MARAAKPESPKSQIANHESRIQPKSRRAWRAWLRKHHASSSGVWVVFAKKASGLPTVTYNDAVEEALCFGWIDGLTHPVDDTYYAQRFTPRKPKSRWAASNKARVEKLIAAGLMTEAGMKMIELAQARGTWNAFDEVDALTVPPDFKRALAATAGAKKGYDAYTPGMKKQCLHYLHDAKRPETRARRIALIIEAAAAGKKPFSA
jgi:uncharacterized protein YdeI (YjbR/CyaY-like superfamily)